MSILKKTGRFIKFRLINVGKFLKLLIFWKKGNLWLYKHRFLRMDANEAINDEARRNFHKDRYFFAVRTLKNSSKPPRVILDAASGTGYGSDILKGLSPDLIKGIDISPEAVTYANKKYGDAICSFQAADVTVMDGLSDNHFDAAVSFETIEHLAEPLNFLAKLHRVLKSDGQLVLSTPNKWGPTRDHQYDYDYNLLVEHLEQYFVIDQIYTQNSGCKELWVNRGAERRLVKTTPENKETAECFIAVCRNK